MYHTKPWFFKHDDVITKQMIKPTVFPTPSHTLKLLRNNPTFDWLHFLMIRIFWEGWHNQHGIDAWQLRYHCVMRRTHWPKSRVKWNRPIGPHWPWAVSVFTYPNFDHALSIKNTFKSRETLFNSILSSFGTRLDKLEKAVIPVHRQTVELQQLQASGGLKCSISL